MASVDGVSLEILRNYFRAIVEDMARVVERTAFTTFVKETADFSTGLIAPTGEYIAYPWRLGATPFLGMNLRPAIEFTPHYEPGDIVIMNDPATTGGLCTHLPDIHLLKPIFCDDEIVAFGYSFIHASDVGGAVPASVWPRAREIYQEGLRLRPTKLYRAGVLNQDVLNIIADNSRIPDMNWGDIKAMVAAVNTGERRLHAVIEKFGVELVRESITGLLDQVEERARTALATIPDGSYSFVDYMEDDLASDVPVRLAVKLVASKGDITLDFTGTDPQVSAALNIYTSGSPHPFLAQALFAYVFMVDNDIPRIGSVMRPISMTLPPGTVVNPQFPAACGSRFGTSMRLTDTVLGALAQAVPDRVPAASSGAISPVVGSLMDPVASKRHVTVLEPMIGGVGALPYADGQSACDTTNGFLRNTPIESIEADIPIVMRRYDFIPDSGGAGRHRGGMAMCMEFQVFHPDTIVTARGQERFRLQPWGVGGGFCGSTGSTLVNPDTARAQDIGKIDVLHLAPGDIVRISAPAGGGNGDPLDRDPALVARDVRARLVTDRAARDEYGVILVNGVVDDAATGERRATLLRSRGSRAGFDYGPSRRQLEEAWPLAVSAECARLANTLPIPVRDYAKHAMFDAARTIATERTPTPADMQVACEELRKRLGRALA
jgi:N-methylhydantoinase B